MKSITVNFMFSISTLPLRMFSRIRTLFSTETARILPETDEKEIPGFWTGPYGVRVPVHIKCIKSPDRLNTISRIVDSSGASQVIRTTLVATSPPMNSAEYCATLCQKIGGEWYYTRR
jgi:hypothetical protein